MLASRKIGCGLALAWAAALPVPVSAHHSFNAFFEMDRFVEVEGRVIARDWVNPHIKLYLEAPDGEEWEVEAGPTNLLSRMGVDRDLVAVGDRVRVRGNPARRQERALWVTNILLADATEILANPMAEPHWAAADAAVGDSSRLFGDGDDPTADGAGRSMFRVWVPPIGQMPFPEEEPELTERGRRAQAAYDRGEAGVGDCERPGVPFAMISPYPIELVDGGERIVIRAEAYDLERVVHMEPLAAAPEPSPLGYSLGRWEQGGDALVVETTRIDYHSYGDLGPAQSDASRLVERFALSPDGAELGYEVTVTDPVMLAAPWTWRGRFVYREDEELRAWNCGVEAP